VPVEGEQVTADGHVLRAERVQGRRIGRVRIASATPSAPVLDLAVSAENGPPE
jgi:hypothetical protein